MYAGLSRTGRRDFVRLAGLLGGAIRITAHRISLRALLCSGAMILGCGAWTLSTASESRAADGVAPSSELTSSQPASSGGDPTAGQARAANASADAANPEAELDGLRISSQTWRRGGLGSRALVTFTVRNDNDYAVKDIEISCAFNRRDGSHLTDRRRVLSDTIDMKSRKIFSRVPVGFVNVNAGQAKCSLVAAGRM